MNYSEFLADQDGLLSAGWALATNLQADEYFYKLVTGTSGTFAPGISTSPIPWAVGVNIQSLKTNVLVGVDLRTKLCITHKPDQL